MALLRGMAFLFLIFFCSCNEQTITQTISLETDSYISSVDVSNHAALDRLLISKSADVEERGIIRLPTGKEIQPNSPLLDEMLAENPLAIITLLPFIMFYETMYRLLDCDAQTLSSSNLTEAKLVFDVLDSQGSNLTGQLNLKVLSKAWWQNVSWRHAHRFSSRGKWDVEGGDFDPSVTTVVGASSGSTLEFDVTSYFRQMLDELGSIIHYGMAVSAESSTLERVTLASTQYSLTTQRPRIVATYVGTCLNLREGVTSTVYLGHP